MKSPFLPLLCISAILTLPIHSATASEIALIFGGANLVDQDTNLRKVEGRGTLDLNEQLSPEADYHGPVFYGSYGRSANGSVDTARITNNAGPYSQDMLGFTEGAIGTVDQMYALVRFPSTSFEGRFQGEKISLARHEAMSIRTYTGYSPDQVGWFHFYVEVGENAYVSPPLPFTQDTEGDWGEKTITVNDPREIRWTRAVFRDGTAFLAGDRPEETPDFGSVTAVGFVFHTAGQEGADPNNARFMTDFFMVSAE